MKRGICSISLCACAGPDWRPNAAVKPCSADICFRVLEASPKGYEKSVASKLIFSLNAWRDLLIRRVASALGRWLICAY